MVTMAEALRRIEELSRRLEERIQIPAFDSSAARVGVGEALQAGSNVTLSKSGNKIVIASSGGGGGSALTVREEDGAPSDAAVTIIRVPNGGLTDNGVGDVSLGYELAGAVATHAGQADPHTGYVLESVLTTRGDLIRRSATGPERFAAVTNHAIVHGDGTDVVSGKGFIWLPVAEWYIDGLLRADTSNPQGGPRRIPNFATAGVLVEGTSIFGGLGVAPAGASVIFDIKHSATYEGSQTSIFETSYPTIAAGDTFTGDASSNDGTIDTSPTDYTAVDDGFYWLYVRQVGSTGGSEGKDLYVQVMAKCYVEF